MKLAIGLVVKGGKEFIDRWIESIERVRCIALVVDNGADEEVRKKLLNHKQVKQYHIQNNMGRNMSRDYQKVLEMAREENVTWLWNLDIDEAIPEIDMIPFIYHFANTTDESIGFPFFEMRNDDQHYIMVENDPNEGPKDARLGHKMYKVLSHFQFNEKDYHGAPIPHNCKPGGMVPIPIQHFGHFTKELRDKRKECYTEDIEDKSELKGTWMKEDDEVIIKKWGERPMQNKK